jgi:alkylation response protein AidB-like acyl-CoA dehydrogenase
MAETISEQDFERSALSFLEANAEPRVEGRQGWGEGSDQVSILPERTLEEEIAELDRRPELGPEAVRRRLQLDHRPRRSTAEGACPATTSVLYDGLEARFATPPMSPYGIGLGHGGAHDPGPRHRRGEGALPDDPMWRGDIVACQLFSEPGAGSDLASLQTKAVRDGDEWMVTGQKVWTSGAHLSDIGEIICRTEPRRPQAQGAHRLRRRHARPGVEIRPLRQMTGGASFNEVFFTEVRIPDSHRLGDVNEGWTVALTTLMNERAAIGGGMASGGSGNMSTQRLIELVRHQGKANDPLVRQQLADIIINGRVASLHQPPGHGQDRHRPAPGARDVDRQADADHANMRRMSDLVSSVLGPKLVADTGEWGTYAWSSSCSASRDADRRGDRRGPPQHHRRARPRPPQGAVGPEVVQARAVQTQPRS